MNLPPAKLREELGDGFEESFSNFALNHAAAVVRTARVRDRDVNEQARSALALSRNSPETVFKSERADKGDYYFLGGEQLLFYSTKVSVVDGNPTAGEVLSNIWDDLLSNNLHNEGAVSFPKGKKPEALVKRCIELSTKSGDLVLDSFAGSGTTAAVAHKMRRRWITVEIGDHATSHVAKRLASVITGGDPSGITAATNWTGGGGFRYCTLGKPLFDEWGAINDGVTFADLAAFAYFSETGSPIPARAMDGNPLIGTFDDRAIYLLFAPDHAGVASATAGNILTIEQLEALPLPAPDWTGPRVVYGEGCTVPTERLAAAGVTFKQVPYQLAGA